MKHTHKPTDTHTYTRRCCCEKKHALTLKYVPGESDILPTINGRQKKRKEEGNLKKETRGEETIVRAHDREEGRKNQESVLRDKTVFSLPAVKGAGLRKRASRRLEAWSPRPRLRSPLSLFSPPRCLSSFSTHLTCSTSPPPPPKKKGHTRTLFPFLQSHIDTASSVVDGRSVMTDKRCNRLLCRESTMFLHTLFWFTLLWRLWSV